MVRIRGHAVLHFLFHPSVRCCSAFAVSKLEPRPQQDWVFPIFGRPFCRPLSPVLLLGQGEFQSPPEFGFRAAVLAILWPLYVGDRLQDMGKCGAQVFPVVVDRFEYDGYDAVGFPQRFRHGALDFKFWPFTCYTDTSIQDIWRFTRGRYMKFLICYKLDPFSSQRYIV